MCEKCPHICGVTDNVLYCENTVGETECGFSPTVSTLVLEVGLASITLAYRNTWFGNKKGERLRGEKLLIPRWLHSMEATAVLCLVIKG